MLIAFCIIGFVVLAITYRQPKAQDMQELPYWERTNEPGWDSSYEND